MKGLRELSQTLKTLSYEQAKWELKMSKEILSNKKKLFILLLLTLPIIITLGANAAGASLPDKIPVLGGKSAYMPSFVNNTMFFGSILVGLIAGLITGVIGAGGGYILTPALMSFGVKGIMAVGTDQFHLFAKAIMGTTIHRKLGNVNFGLASWFVVGSFGGVFIGGTLNRAIFQYNPTISDSIISLMYVLVLGILGFYAIYDWIKQSKNKDTEKDENLNTTKFALSIQKLPLPPFITFDKDIVEGGRKISFLPLVVCGFIVGFVASIMGVGGGFLTFPMFVYGLGVSTFTTVGTDILQIIFTTFYSSIFQYAIYGFVFYTVAIGMLLGSLIGVQIGAMVTTVVKGAQIRAFYALTILAGFINRVCALPKKLAELGYITLSKDASTIIENTGNVVFFAIVSIFSLWILKEFVKNIVKTKLDTAAKAGATKTGVIVNPNKFWAGVTGLVLFVMLLAAGYSPVINGQNTLAWADNLFNQLSKSSSDYISETDKKAEACFGTSIDVGISPKEFAEADKIIQLLKKNGFDATKSEDGKVKIKGDLGKISKTAVSDAKLAFDNKNAELESKYQIKPEEVTYCWWIIYDGLAKKFTQENNVSIASFTKTMSTKVFEPAYNFRGIESQGFDKVYVFAIILLLFYVIYTLWYGFSIMFVFEGLGITAESHKKKE